MFHSTLVAEMVDDCEALHQVKDIDQETAAGREVRQYIVR